MFNGIKVSIQRGVLYSDVHFINDLNFFFYLLNCILYNNENATRLWKYCFGDMFRILQLHFYGILIRGNKGLILITDVTNSERYQRLNKILLFLPTLHLGNQQSCLQENAIRRRNLTQSCAISMRLSVIIAHVGFRQHK